ncbi:MAG: carotenoid oxygenase family protein [Actinomycetota bacterium]|nr:carotenoid oxygenase family protein [Actinomycetota bacterium]
MTDAGDDVGNPYLEGAFAPVREERTDDHELSMDGALPPDLEGRLLRVGPNPAVTPTDPGRHHWLAGDGMVHAVDLAGGRAVGYRNRFVRTRALARRIGTPAPRGPHGPVDGPANANVVRHAGVLLALDGSGPPLALGADLTTARVHDFDGALTAPVAPHPKRDPDGGLVLVGSDVFGPPFLRTHLVDADGVLVRTDEIDVPRATLVHDVGLTGRFLVLLDLPVVFDLGLAADGISVPYRWMADAGARVGLVDRRAGTGVRWIAVEPCSVFHVANAFDDGDDVVVDVVRHPSAFDEPPGGRLGAHGHLTRWRLPATGTVSEEQLDDRPVELPRTADAAQGRPYRYAYGVVLDDAPAPTPVALVKYDLERDESSTYAPGPGRVPSEAVFVPAADGRSEDEGWVLTVVQDAARGASDLVVLDATSFSGPPVATVHLPARVPVDLHGTWLPAG